MQRRQFTTAVFFTSLLGSDPLRAAGFSQSEAVQGLRAALERGAQVAIGQLGRADGFLGNPRVRIPLPGFLNDAARLLKATGQQHKLDELVTAMNRGAEAAMPQARDLLLRTARDIGVDDAMKIVRGGETAVTEFFAGKTRQPLSQQFLPIVTRATDQVALADKFNAVAGKAARLGLLKGDDTNIQRHVTAKALDGLYLVIGDEERKIRRDPVATGSALLKQVFGR
jgi:hypothetical protein